MNYDKVPESSEEPVNPVHNLTCRLARVAMVLLAPVVRRAFSRRRAS